MNEIRKIKEVERRIIRHFLIGGGVFAFYIGAIELLPPSAQDFIIALFSAIGASAIPLIVAVVIIVAGLAS